MNYHTLENMPQCCLGYALPIIGAQVLEYSTWYSVMPHPTHIICHVISSGYRISPAGTRMIV